MLPPPRGLIQASGMQEWAEVTSPFSSLSPALRNQLELPGQSPSCRLPSTPQPCCVPPRGKAGPGGAGPGGQGGPSAEDGAPPSPRAQPGAHRGQGRSPPCLLFVVLFLPFSRLLWTLQEPRDSRNSPSLCSDPNARSLAPLSFSLLFYSKGQFKSH